jgi:hypothetical protein
MIYSYRTDAEDRIVWLDQSWVVFAKNNWRPDFQPDWVLGRSLWDFIDGPDTQEVYRLALRHIQLHQRALTLPFRCDSPDIRRFMEMTVAPLADGGLSFNCLLLREEVRAPVNFRPCGPCAPGRALKACSICLRLERPVWTDLGRPGGQGEAVWQEAEAVLPLVAALEEGYFPPVSYRVCPDCRVLLGKPTNQ